VAVAFPAGRVAAPETDRADATDRSGGDSTAHPAVASVAGHVALSPVAAPSATVQRHSGHSG